MPIDFNNSSAETADETSGGVIEPELASQLEAVTADGRRRLLAPEWKA